MINGCSHDLWYSFTPLSPIYPNFHHWVSYYSDKPLQKIHIQFSSVWLLSRVRLLATPWNAARQASLSITNSRSLPKLMSIESVMPSNHLVLCHPLLLLPSIFPSIRVFSNESALLIIQKAKIMASGPIWLYKVKNPAAPGKEVNSQLLSDVVAASFPIW